MFSVESIPNPSGNDQHRVTLDKDGLEDLMTWLKELRDEVLLINTSKLVKVSFWSSGFGTIYNSVFFHKYQDVDFFLTGVETMINFYKEE
jgi:hypothetical protein